MSQSNRYEQEFLAKLKAVFIGAQVEGDSGYINLMRIKARYFEEGVFPQLRRDVDAACMPFERITADSVEFADGSMASLPAPDWATVKPLIWW